MAQKTTVVEVTSRREPLTGLAITTDGANFSRRAEVMIKISINENGRVGEDWRTIGSGVLQDLALGTVHRSSLALTFPETRATAYRIVINDGDNPPLRVTGVQGRGDVYRALFLSGGTDRYALYYGGADVGPADYDAAAVLGPLRKDCRPVLWTMEPGAPNPAYAPTAAEERGAFFKRKSVLFSGIALVVLALGWALIRAVRHTEQATQEPPEGD
ncbi:MAG: hypothetical protein ABIF71_10810 [Planctomycetota bacterium]